MKREEVEALIITEDLGVPEKGHSYWASGFYKNVGVLIVVGGQVSPTGILSHLSC